MKNYLEITKKSLMFVASKVFKQARLAKNITKIASFLRLKRKKLNFKNLVHHRVYVVMAYTSLLACELLTTGKDEPFFLRRV